MIGNSKAPVSLQDLFKEKDNSVYNLRSKNNQFGLDKSRTEYEVVLTLRPWKAIEWYFPVVMCIMIYKVIMLCVCG